MVKLRPAFCRKYDNDNQVYCDWYNGVEFYRIDSCYLEWALCKSTDFKLNEKVEILYGDNKSLIANGRSPAHC